MKTSYKKTPAALMVVTVVMTLWAVVVVLVVTEITGEEVSNSKLNSHADSSKTATSSENPNGNSRENWVIFEIVSTIIDTN